jgi:hypothetical protein
LEVFGSNLFVACLTSLRVGSRLSHISMMGDVGILFVGYEGVPCVCLSIYICLYLYNI